VTEDSAGRLGVPGSFQEAFFRANELLADLEQRHEIGQPLGGFNIQAVEMSGFRWRLKEVSGRAESAETRRSAELADLRSVTELLGGWLARIGYPDGFVTEWATEIFSENDRDSDVDARSLRTALEQFLLQVDVTRDPSPLERSGGVVESLDRTKFMDPRGDRAELLGSRDKTVRIPGPVSKVGRYELQGELGRGGMGVVHKAWDPSLRRQVAVKILDVKDLNSTRVERFRREARLAARLSHPQIVTVHEVGEDRSVTGDPIYFIAMELIRGQGLDLAYGEMSFRERVECVMLVSRAVGYAHDHEVIHRDLKPANILLNQHGEPVVTDFGLAREVEGETHLTRTGAIMGTPSHMAPEQIVGDPSLIGKTTDVWALGVILYQMVCGRLPFLATHSMGTARLIQDEDPFPPRRVNQEISRDLEAIIFKALEKRPSSRYSDANQMANDLRRHLGGDSVEARRIRTAHVMMRWSWRRRATLIPLLLVFLVVFSGVFWGWRERRNYQAQTERALKATQDLLVRARSTSREEQKPRVLQSWVDQIVRVSRPEVVQYLLRPEFLSSASTWERFLVIAALGRIRDRTTEGPEGLDSVEKLCQILKTIDLEDDLDLAVEVARSLAQLGDPRAFEVMWNRRRDFSGRYSLFAEKSEAFLRELAAQGEGESRREWVDPVEKVLRKSVLVEGNERLAILDAGIQEFGQERRILLERAAYSYRHGHPKKALVDLDRLIEQDSEDLILRVRRAEILCRLLRFGEALEDIEQVKQKGLSARLDAHISCIRGEIFLELRKGEKAMDELNRSIQLDANRSKPFFLRGQVFFRMKRFDQARKDLSRSISIHPTDSALKVLGSTYIQLRNHGEALGAFRRLELMFPKSSLQTEMLLERGVAHLGMKDLPAALRDFEECVTALPSDHKRYWQAWQRLGIARTISGNVQGARQAFGQALQWAPPSRKAEVRKTSRTMLGGE
jgi:tetratricopeptide (TPR) repeat protein